MSPDDLPPAVPGKLKVFLLIQSQHLHPQGGFRDASLSPTNEQPQRFGVSVLKDLDFAGDISWGSVLVLSQSEGDVPID